jgi:hypothetical protein
VAPGLDSKIFKDSWASGKQLKVAPGMLLDIISSLSKPRV